MSESANTSETIGIPSDIMSFISAHDRELFHSNMLAYLAIRHPEFFKAVFGECLGLQTEFSYCHKVNRGQIREWNHLDMALFRDTECKDPVFVLENKVKSLPSLEQLLDYNCTIDANKPEKSSSPIKVLLSLIGGGDIFDSNDEKSKSVDKKQPLFYLNTDWYSISYRDLAKSMRHHLDLLGCGFDYCVFIRYIKNIENLYDKFEGLGEIVPDSAYPQCLRLTDEQQKSDLSRLFEIYKMAKVCSIINRTFSEGFLKLLNGNLCTVGRANHNALTQLCINIFKSKEKDKRWKKSTERLDFYFELEKGNLSFGVYHQFAQPESKFGKAGRKDKKKEQLKAILKNKTPYIICANIESTIMRKLFEECGKPIDGTETDKFVDGNYKGEGWLTPNYFMPAVRPTLKPTIKEIAMQIEKIITPILGIKVNA